MKKLALFGGGGHGCSCIDVIEAHGDFIIEAVIEQKEFGKAVLCGYPVREESENLEELWQQAPNGLIGIGQVKDAEPRRRLFQRLRKLGFEFPVIVSPTAYVSKRATLGAGTIVMHGAVVNAGATIGENCIINSQALVEHGVSVGHHCHVSTGAKINGDCVLGDKVFVGSGAVIFNSIRVSDGTLVPALSVIKQDV